MNSVAVTADHDVLTIRNNAKVRDAIRLFKKLNEDAEYHDALMVVDRTGRYVGKFAGRQTIFLWRAKSLTPGVIYRYRSPGG